MEKSQILRGMATVSYYADDVKEARDWYSKLLGIEPYFQRPDEQNPAYIEFRIGDYQHELGIIDRRWSPAKTKEPGGVVLFWHVDDVETTMHKLTDMGAQVYEPVIRREAGFITASVIDPFGNILGIMYNPHYLDILAEKGMVEEMGHA